MLSGRFVSLFYQLDHFLMMMGVRQIGCVSVNRFKPRVHRLNNYFAHEIVNYVIVASAHLEGLADTNFEISRSNMKSL